MIKEDQLKVTFRLLIGKDCHKSRTKTTAYFVREKFLTFPIFPRFLQSLKDIVEGKAILIYREYLPVDSKCDYESAMSFKYTEYKINWICLHK